MQRSALLLLPTSALLLLPASALLLGSACATPRSEVNAVLDGSAYRDGAIWIVPGGSTDLSVRSDRGVPLLDWELAVTDPDVATLGAASRVPESTNQIALAMTAGAAGETVLMIHDHTGALWGEVAVHVRNPDTMMLYAGCASTVCVLDGPQYLLRGTATEVFPAFSVDEIPVDSAAALRIGDDPAGLVTAGPRSQVVTVAAPAGPEAAVVTLLADVDLRAELILHGVASADVIATLTAAEARARPGARMVVVPSITDAAGHRLLTGPGRWTASGEGGTAGLPSYTYDPAAEPTEVSYSIGEGADQVTATATIHRAR